MIHNSNTAYSQQREFFRLRRRACDLLRSDSIVAVLDKLCTEIDSGRLAVRDDRAPYVDVVSALSVMLHRHGCFVFNRKDAHLSSLFLVASYNLLTLGNVFLNI